jgi:hypothetical protein
MADHKEQLLSMLKDLIAGNNEQASVTLHDYYVAKTRDVLGTAPAEVQMEEDPDFPELDLDDDDLETE